MLLIAGISANGVLLVYAISNARRVTDLQRRVGAAEVTVNDLKAHDDSRRALIDRRLSVLELALFGTKPPPEKPLLVTPAWPRNWQIDVNRRLSALEQYRLQTDGKKKDDGPRHP